MRMLALLVIAAFVLTWVTARSAGNSITLRAGPPVGTSVFGSRSQIGVTQWSVTIIGESGARQVYSATTTLQIALPDDRQVLVENGEAKIRFASGEVLMLKPLPARP